MFTLIQKNLKNDYTSILLNIFNNNKEWSYGSIALNCYLTENLKNKIPLSLKKEITEPFFDSSLLHHIHVLKFKTNGILDYHDHSPYEVYSFVLYMDNIGGTLFQTDKDELFIHSRPNRLVLFDSKIKHKAINDNKERIVAAGGIIKK